jgi:hypothetical protein
LDLSNVTVGQHIGFPRDRQILRIAWFLIRFVNKKNMARITRLTRSRVVHLCRVSFLMIE